MPGITAKQEYGESHLGVPITPENLSEVTLETLSDVILGLDPRICRVCPYRYE
ncbi:hypothetical protein LJR030_002152 [Rhizobium sp. LjRoot30]|uniref:hypothetical protein n=1 Tax=Rhizobium sp. LjRoot30 TaxID=3342320 RepID=UPI003ED16966